MVLLQTNLMIIWVNTKSYCGCWNPMFHKQIATDLMPRYMPGHQVCVALFGNYFRKSSYFLLPYFV